MNHDHRLFLNPNYLHGFHPCDLRAYFENAPFFEKLDSDFPINLVPEPDTTPKVSYRQQVLERLLANISAKDLIGKEAVEQYLRDQYRRNCKPNTLRLGLAWRNRLIAAFDRLCTLGIVPVSQSL